MDIILENNRIKCILNASIKIVIVLQFQLCVFDWKHLVWKSQNVPTVLRVRKLLQTQNINLFSET